MSDQWDEDDVVGRIRVVAANAIRAREERISRVESEAATRQPDWKLWQNIRHTSVPNLVALSCNIDPEFARHFYETHDSPRNYTLCECPTEYARRFKMATSNIAWKEEAFTNVYVSWPEKAISLSEFRAWGELLPNPLIFPEEFPQTADHAATDKQLDARERTTLLCIIGALATNAKLDLSQPMKAGDTVAAMMPSVRISGRTIGEHLKAAREAMENRKA